MPNGIPALKKLSNLFEMYCNLFGEIQQAFFRECLLYYSLGCTKWSLVGFPLIRAVDVVQNL